MKKSFGFNPQFGLNGSARSKKARIRAWIPVIRDDNVARLAMSLAVIEHTPKARRGWKRLSPRPRRIGLEKGP
jgi:hypothetical protein